MADEFPVGCVVLVVEDELLIALDLCNTLECLGCEILGPANSSRKALSLLETDKPDFALLDENLAGESSLPVAEELRRRRIPFAIVSGYDSPGRKDPALVDARRLRKPASEKEIRDALQQLSTSRS